MTINPVYDRVTSGIEKYGWAAVGVSPTIDDPPDTPAFTYSVNFAEKYGVEVVIVGVSVTQGHNTLATVWDELEKGNLSVLTTERSGDILHDYQTKMVELSDACGFSVANQIAEAIGITFKPMQLLWPDTQNILPDEPGCEERFVNLQISEDFTQNWMINDTTT